MTAWNFIAAMLSGAGTAVVVSLVFIGRYQQKVDANEARIEENSALLMSIVSDLGEVKGQLKRINGGGRKPW